MAARRPPERGSRVALCPVAQAIAFEDRLILVDPDRRSLSVLNESAGLVWEMLAAGMPPPEIGSALADRYGIAPTAAHADVDGILARWLAAGLVARERAPSAPLSSPPSAVRWPRRFAATRTYAMCGRPLRLRFASASLQGLIHPLLAPWQSDAPDAKETLHLFRDGAGYVVATGPDEWERADDAEHATGCLINRLLDLSYPQARWSAIMHAGAVAHRGRAIVLPGASGSGKSTLTTALALSGFDYLADDVVALDGHTGRIMPAPFAACLKPGSWPLIADLCPDAERLVAWTSRDHTRRYLDLSDRTPRQVMTGFPVLAFVFPRYDPHAQARLEPLTPLDSLQRLVDARCWVSLDPDNLASFLEHLRRARHFEITYSLLQSAADLCRSLTAIR